ncbi:NADH-quinone oxidoreductase subunit N [Prevotella sp. tc2-28]|uniref:NADH-quinone oxidoreductase subunit N n=1 Tax=Prevotella sp. tc2-28 TaxID=1761888 RepID=UPI00089ACE73|nr:NADH-quinone oxidoreductase subunit N [Prevotella sp. tc2-28]SDZ88608.1 NADH-quinone oxidoreductase subunit N [Prevotella sp. tc2-28]
MNYGQFLRMMPEFYLVLILLVVFAIDFIMHRGEKKHDVLSGVAVALMLVLPFQIALLSEPAAAFGGMYVATQAANVMKIILSIGTVIVMIMAEPWLKNECSKREGEFYLLVISTLLGMFIMMSSGNFLLFFLGLETASVPMACLVAMDKWKKNSAEGAAKYILTATFSSGIMLYGLSFVYGATGTLYFDDIANRIAYMAQYKSQLPMLIMGLVFFFSGLGFKLSLVPFHFWTADTYEGAPTPVTGYLSVVSKGAAAFALMFILMHAFGPLIKYWEYLLYIVIVLSITIANLFAIRQSELKRFMAFSSISQAGYIMLAVIGASQMGMASLMYYVLVYVVANMAVFTVISTVEQNNGGTTLMSSYNGLYQTNPKLAFLMTLALFSLAGIPPFAGMFSKFFVFMAAAQQGSFWAYFVVFIALINTVVSLYYYLLIVKAMYIKQTDTPLPTFRTELFTRVALALCTAGIVLFGICSCLYDYLFSVSKSVM